MQYIFQTIGKGVVTLGVVVASLFGYSTPVNVGATIPVSVAVFQTSLQSSITSTATSMTLVSGVNGAGNNLSGYTCFNIDEGTAIEEFVCGTASGASITSMIRGIDPVDGDTEVSALKKAHRRGASVKITNYPALAIVSRVVNGDETLPNALSYAGAVTCSSSTQLCPKSYVDATVSAGSPNASDILKGISKLSVAPVSSTDPIAVGDNDTRVPTQSEKDAMIGTSGTAPSTSNAFVDLDDTATAATANKVARRLAGGNITVVTETQGNNSTNAASTAYVDAGLSALPSTPTQQQSIPYYVGNSVTAQEYMFFQSNSTGTVAFLGFQTTANTNLNIKRLQKDTLTGQYFITHEVTLTPPSTNISSPFFNVIGNYLYIGFADSGVETVRRYDAADLTNLTSITISGGSGVMSSSGFTDGTYFYGRRTADIYKKYSISGTTFTYVTEITYTGAAGPSGAVCDGTNVYVISGVSGSNSIVKYPLAGGSATSTTTRFFYPDAYYLGAVTFRLFIMSSGRLGMVYGHSISNPTAAVGSVAEIMTITLP